MRTLTKEELDSLTESEQELAKALGLDTASWKRTKKGHAKATGGESYILITNLSCRLCSSLHTKIFEMVKKGSSLHSKEIPEVPSKEALGDTKVKSAYYTTRCCSNCYSYLTDLTKESLVQKFLSYINNSKNFMV
jgi:hypothetical protein